MITSGTAPAQAPVAILGLLALFAAGGAGCLEDYVPPPSVASINAEQGLYDPEAGPLEMRFTAPLRASTLSVSIRLDRRDGAGRLCLPSAAGALPAGCRAPSEVVLGPCAVDPRRATRLAGSQVRYECDGGAIALDAEQQRIAFDPEQRLVPYQSYVVLVEPGLEDKLGRRRRIGSEVRFQVKGRFPLAPSDFMPGMFFAVFDIVEPVTAQVRFFLWFELKPSTGETRIFGASIKPNGPEVDRLTDRDPSHYHPEPNPPAGASLLASGQIAAAAEGRTLVIFPFPLSVAVPRVEAAGTELSGRIERAMFTGAPAGERDVIGGRMSAASVFLGDGPDRSPVGAGTGRFSMFRMTDAEAPPLSAILPRGRTEADVHGSFGE